MTDADHASLHNVFLSVRNKLTGPMRELGALLVKLCVQEAVCASGRGWEPVNSSWRKSLAN